MPEQAHRCLSIHAAGNSQVNPATLLGHPMTPDQQFKLLAAMFVLAALALLVAWE